MSDKPKYPRKEALAVARELCLAFMPHCVEDRIKVCGSLRRGKAEVGDIEIVYISSVGAATLPGELMPHQDVNLMDAAIGHLIDRGILCLRPNKNGATAFGPLNKLMVHVASGIPVDLFATIEQRWWMTVVVRTGGKESNMRLASRAIEKGWNLNAYGIGFTDQRGMRVPVTCEEDVWHLLDLPYQSPQERS